MKMIERDVLAVMFFVLSLVTVGACGSDTGAVDERDGIDYSSILDENRDEKADGMGTCGEEPCENRLCGWVCTGGEDCMRTCATRDTRPEAYLAFQVSGSTSARADSRDYPYEPVVSLTNVLFYGCDHWDFSHGKYDALDLWYEEIYEGAWTPGEPENKGLYLKVQLDTPFQGPGSYQAGALFSKSSEASAAKDYYVGRDACEVSVQGDEEGGILGVFSCTLPHKSGSGSASVTGEFACGPTAISGPQIIRLPQGD